MLSHSLWSLIHVVYIKSESSGRWKLELFETKKRYQDELVIKHTYFPLAEPQHPSCHLPTSTSASIE